MSDADYRYCPHCRTELAAVERGGQTRLACPQCRFVHWRNPVPVVAAVVERADRVVLVVAGLPLVVKGSHEQDHR